MEKKQFISEEERVKCLKVIDAYAELYEETDDDIVVLDGEIRFYQITAL